MIGVYITCKDKKEAKKIARYLLLKKLIGCANIFPVDSLYWWKGKIANGKETVILAKSIEKKYPMIVSEVKKIHSYEVPCIIKMKEDANKEYLKWIIGEVK
ncbi:MAG TPA: divalent-cation tolerance protein CutA [Candidatus Nanoarchaeia archaeon]|nr:divalent-cation tolerance protein CutA [Candidatus Nanoarchaeia archaeon]